MADLGAKNIEVIQGSSVLLVKGTKAEEEVSHYLRRGIVNRGFNRQFEVADYVRFEGASLGKGVLRIDLKRENPEAMKPQKIALRVSQNDPHILVTQTIQRIELEICPVARSKGLGWTFSHGNKCVRIWPKHRYEPI